jgi:N-acetyllactosaminide beta-1,3-N-acetylglucosaminyltransferase
MLIDQPNKCAKKPFLLLAIKSLTPHFARRQAIQGSWSRESNVGNQMVVRVFLLGQTPLEDNHPDLSDMLRFESEKHQGTF